MVILEDSNGSGVYFCIETVGSKMACGSCAFERSILFMISESDWHL